MIRSTLLFRSSFITAAFINSSNVLAVLQNLDEGAGAKLFVREARKPDGLRFGDRAAVYRAQEVVEQPLSRRGVVEHVADEGCARGLLDEVTEALGRRAETLKEESVDGRVARRELCGVQVPPLIEGVRERLLNVLVV